MAASERGPVNTGGVLLREGVAADEIGIRTRRSRRGPVTRPATSPHSSAKPAARRYLAWGLDRSARATTGIHISPPRERVRGHPVTSDSTSVETILDALRLIVVLNVGADGSTAMTESWVSIDDVVAHLKVTKDSIYRWIESRGLPAQKVGRHWRFKLSEIDLWVREGQAGDAPSAPDEAARRTSKGTA